MDILSDVSINGSLTVNKNLEVVGTTIHRGYLTVSGTIFTDSGFGFGDQMIDITKDTFNFNDTRLRTVSIPNVYICSIFYGDSTSINGVVHPCDISQTKHLVLEVPDGCQKFVITEIKNQFLPSIMMIDTSVNKEIKMDLSVDIHFCGYGNIHYYAVASRESTNDSCYLTTVIE